MSSGDILIGNYEVISELGSGAFGRVFLARHIVLTNRVVAIKLLHSMHLNSQEEIIKFLKEAQFLEKLKHPHILSVIDVGFYEGFPYLVTEYASKGSLRDLLQNQPSQLLPQEKSLAILTQIGQALTHAHQQNIVHRDLKPENILFNENGEVLIADFGLATVLGSTSVKETNTAGTMAYMAPEQFHDMVSKESDQYALGCLAYELFTGHMPFVASNLASLITKCLMEKPTAPRTHNSQLSVQIENAILKAMAKERNERFASVSAFVEALSQTTSESPQKTKEEWIYYLYSMGIVPNRNMQQFVLECDIAIQQYPDLADAYLCKAVTLNDLNRHKDALINFERYILLKPNYSPAWYYKADLLQRFGRMEEAQKAYSRAEELEKIEESEDEDDSIGDDYLIDNDKENLEEFDKEFEIDQNEIFFGKRTDVPNCNFAEEYIEKGKKFEEELNYQEALKSFEQAIYLNPYSIDARIHAGVMLEELKRYEEALSTFEKVIQLDGYSAFAWLAKANILFNLNRYNDAIFAFDEVIQLDAKSLIAYSNKGVALFSLERFEEALNAYEHATQLDEAWS
jgi:serine/threonine protein kinase